MFWSKQMGLRPYKKWIGVVLAGFLLAGCAEDGRMFGYYDESLIGGKEDQHGCLPAAGYQFSQLLNRCVRVFSVGVNLEDPGNKNKTFVSRAIFSPDGEKAELFLPYRSIHDILVRNGDVWTDGYFTLKQKRTTKGSGIVWVLESKDDLFNK